MSVTNHEAQALLPKVQCFFGLLVGRYDDTKYPQRVYQDLRATFSVPANVTSADIELALRWKYGKLDQDDFPENQASTIERLADRWNHLVAADDNRAKVEALKDPGNSTYDFVSRAFLVHLVSPQDSPIIDRFNYRAVRCLLGNVRPDFSLGYLPRVYEDIELVHSFITRLRAVWGPNPPDYEVVDRYLMMFGRNVAPKY